MFFFETEFETGTLDFLIVVKRIFEIGQQITQISTHYLKTGPPWSPAQASRGLLYYFLRPLSSKML